MPMTREEFRAATQNILGLASPENQAAASELLSAMADEFDSRMTESESRAGRVSELETANEALRAANMKLFLRVGEPGGKGKPEETTPPAPGTDIPEIKIESLFNEKGELI